ncbi:MAG: M20/M25/M40 family metallo-hydrolase [Paraglaciecola sp.]|uniref:M20/M25/M40 family metallo-hydrolase n=1 Tax=Paraglaciecola sp. TaxID=1920173 RepID=UPI0032647C4B
MKSTFLVLTLVTGLLQPASFAKPLIEEQIVARIDQGLQQSTDTLKQVVNINSGTLNFEGVKKVAEVFTAEFDGMGFDTQWIDGSEFNRAGHLVASYGTKGPKILMIGHLDTVFAKSDDFQSYQPLDDGFVAGPGIIDMKGGDMIIVSALKALKDLDLLDNVSIRVVLTGDEESSGRPLSLSKKAIVDGAKWADIALGFENGDSNIKTAVVARRSSVRWQLDVTGKPAHSSQIFTDEVGYGAVFEAARILNSFREELAGQGNLTFNPGLIAGGTRVNVQPKQAKADAFGKSNVVAKEVSVSGGVRALTTEELANAKKVMQKIVSDNLAHTSATLSFADGYPPMSPTDNNYKLLSMYSDISVSLGYGPITAVNPRKAGAADISFAAGHVDMAMDGLGLMGAGAHTKGEVADMSSFAKNMHKTAILIYRISQSELD